MMRFVMAMYHADINASNIFFFISIFILRSKQVTVGWLELTAATIWTWYFESNGEDGTTNTI